MGRWVAFSRDLRCKVCRLLLFGGEPFSLDPGLDEIGTAPAGAELFAARFDTQRLLDRLESEAAGDAVVEHFEVAVFEFDDLAAIYADKVIVRGFVEEVWIEGGLPVSEVDLLEQPCLGKECQGPIDRCAGGLGVRSPQLFEEFVGSEVFVAGEDDFHDRVSLGGMAEALHLDEGVEALEDFRCHGLSMIPYLQGRIRYFLTG